MFALNHRCRAVLAQHEVDSAVRRGASFLFDRIAEATKTFPDKMLELLPWHRTDAVETGLRVKQATTIEGIQICEWGKSRKH